MHLLHQPAILFTNDTNKNKFAPSGLSPTAFAAALHTKARCKNHRLAHLIFSMKTLYCTPARYKFKNDTKIIEFALAGLSLIAFAAALHANVS